MTVTWLVAVQRIRAGARALAALALAAAGCGLVIGGTGAAAATTGPAPAVSAGQWRTAIEVPGLAALKAGAGNAGVVSVSCAQAGNCGAGGFYTDRGGRMQGFVVNERNARWGEAARVPGLEALNAGGNAQVVSVSCTSRGRCAAGGFYTDRNKHKDGFLVSERNGRWGKAVEVPGLAALEAGEGSNVNSVSCASAGNCAAGGSYGLASGGSQGFVVNETAGVWGRVQKMPAPPPATGGSAAVTSVSCASAGNCAAGGYYPIPAGPLAVPGANSEAFVVSETAGVWGTPQVPSGLAGLNAGGFAQVSSVSCASAGNCGAAGYWTSEDDGTDDNPGLPNPFVVNEKNGRWGPVHVPSSSKLQLYQSEQITANAVSCPSASRCTAVGGNDNPPGLDGGVYVVTERNGRWRTAQQLPGLATLVVPDSSGAWSGSVSCASAASCGVGGYYSVRVGYEAFVVTERNGRWGRVVKVPGIAALNRGRAARVSAISCPQPNRCAVGGYYTDRHGHTHAFVDSQAQ